MTKLGNARLTGGIPAAALGTPAPAAKASALVERRRQVATGELAVLPVYGEVWIELLGAAATEAIEAATYAAMRRLELPPTAAHVGSYNLHRFCRVLAEAIRDPDDPTRTTRFGTLEEWQEEREEIVAACIQIYMDVRARLDPSAPDLDIGAAAAAELLDAFKKKDWTRLRSFGVATLTAWLATGAVQPSSSPTPASNTGE